jgi:hypothetical protein
MSKSIVVPAGTKGPGIIEVTKATSDKIEKRVEEIERANAAKAAQRATAAAKQHEFVRERVLDQAIHQGIIGASLRSHYGACYDRDSAGTRSHLHNLGMIPVDAAPSAPSDGYDESSLSDAERSRVAAARQGRMSTRVIHGG